MWQRVRDRQIFDSVERLYNCIDTDGPTTSDPTEVDPRIQQIYEEACRRRYGVVNDGNTDDIETDTSNDDVADNRLKNLKQTYHVEPESETYSRVEWLGDTNKGKTLRIVVPLGTVVEIFKHVSYDDYTNGRGFAAALGNISCPLAFRLKKGTIVATIKPTMNKDK